MSHEFEDPRKTDLRVRAEAAIEAAGHEVLDEPVPIDYPEGTALNGRIRGDIQSVDGDGSRHVYFVRPDADRPLPEWIRNTVLASHEIDGVLAHVVVDRISEVVEDGATSCGAGLLIVTEDVTLEQVLAPGAPDEDAVLAAISDRSKDLRRRLDSKTNLNMDANQRRFSEVTDITGGMPSSTRDKYVEAIEQTDRMWREWSERLATDLDRSVAERDANALDLIEPAIEAGPLGPDEPQEG